jgi:hypothetical protein
MDFTDTNNLLPAVIDYTPVIAEYAGRPGVVTIHGCVVPFDAGYFEQTVDAGVSVAEIVRGVCPHVSLHSSLHVYIDGVYIRPDRWAWTYPNGGAVVSMRLVPQGGGGGKDPLRTVLTLAVMAAAFMAPGAAVFLGLPPAFAAGVGGALITAGVGYVGMLAVNSIAPPASQDFGQISGTTTDSPTYSITGARNRYRPWEAIPVVLGTHRVVADKVAATYTENVGDDQYLTMLFCFGYGPLFLRGFKIGENPLSSFDDYEIEIRQGFLYDDPITIYPDSVVQDAESIALTAADGWVQRTTDTETDKIAIDITCPQLVAYDSRGNKETETLEFAGRGPTRWMRLQVFRHGTRPIFPTPCPAVCSLSPRGVRW